MELRIFNLSNYNFCVKVLYHVPSVRRLVLEALSEDHCEEFLALQRTFALMQETKCSWIDPLEFVKLFRKKMPTASTQQVHIEIIFFLPIFLSTFLLKVNI